MMLIVANCVRGVGVEIVCIQLAKRTGKYRIIISHTATHHKPGRPNLMEWLRKQSSETCCLNTDTCLWIWQVLLTKTSGLQRQTPGAFNPGGYSTWLPPEYKVYQKQNHDGANGTREDCTKPSCHKNP